MIAPTPALTDRDAVNLLVYERQRASAWRGVPMDKCAQDLLVYQEIIAALRPSIIVETGSWYGGSALFFADMCELVGHGRVLSIDVKVPQPFPWHDRLNFFEADSVESETVRRVLDWAGSERGLVILDSDHTKAHVLDELDAYSTLVAQGCYLVVEDSNIGGHPVRPELSPGPYEAVQEWLPQHDGFVIDTEIEPYVTFCPSGWLRRTV